MPLKDAGALSVDFPEYDLPAVCVCLLVDELEDTWLLEAVTLDEPVDVEVAEPVLEPVADAFAVFDNAAVAVVPDDTVAELVSDTVTSPVKV